jgi:hypothetical protein
VKVGEPPENVKVLQYIMKKWEIIDEDADGPGSQRGKIKRLGELFKNVFSRTPKFSTKSFHKFERGQIEEVEFATSAWENI